MKKNIVFWMSVSLFAGFLASCGPLSDSSSNETAVNTQKVQLPSPQNQASANQPQPLSGKDVQAPVAIPPRYADRPPEPGQTPTEFMPNGMPALQPAMGTNTDLFSGNVSNTDERFQRVENAVSDLRREFNAIKPAIVRLVAVESDIQDLIKQLDIMLQSPPPAAPTPLVPTSNSKPEVMAQSAPAKPMASPPPKAPMNTGEAVVKTLRTGKYPNKVRLVLDISKKTDFSIDLDNQEKLLIIDLPNAAWSGPAQKTFSSGLLSSYSVEGMNNGNGSRIVINLKKASSILKQQALPPGSNPNFRIFVDLAL